jgi:hypothetical protein
MVKIEDEDDDDEEEEEEVKQNANEFKQAQKLMRHPGFCTFPPSPLSPTLSSSRRFAAANSRSRSGKKAVDALGFFIFLNAAAGKWSSAAAPEPPSSSPSWLKESVAMARFLSFFFFSWSFLSAASATA